MSFLFKPNEYYLLGTTGQNSFWRYLLVFLFLLIALLILASLPMIGLSIYLELDGNPATYINENNLSNPFVCPSWMFTSVVGMSFLISLLAIIFCVRVIHQRPALTVFTTRHKFRWGVFFEGAIIWGLLLLLITGIQAVFQPEIFSVTFNWKPFVISALLILIAIPIQASTEEVIFRGYLPQALSNIPWFKPSPIWPLIISSILFAVLHFSNPEMLSMEGEIFKKILGGLSYILIALIAGIISLRDNSLELAMGLHVGNNVFLSTICGYVHSPLPVETIFQINELNPLLDVIALSVMGVLYYLYFFRLRKIK